jgi:Imidazolonepropionase and related amidohydrolases
LTAAGAKYLDQMLAQGTTTVEAKSGYGLTVEDEVKILEAVRALNHSHAVDLAATFLGAHAIPPGI